MGGVVMVVDDDADIRDVIAMVLRTEGFEPLSACDGDDALSQLRDGAAPRVILMDLMMPGMNGPQLLAALRANPATARIPVVILSGDAAALETARALGANGCLMKPIELDQISTVLHAYA